MRVRRLNGASHLINLAEMDDFCGDVTGGEDFVSYYAAPLIAKGKVRGVLKSSTARRSIPTGWLNFLEMLAQAPLLLTTRSSSTAATIQRRTVATYDATIAGWSHAMNLRDEETENHTLRVTGMTERLARGWVSAMPNWSTFGAAPPA